jgi:signal transduction histidine kinase/ligand-binding sensor domain-containing protein/DNA-binding response OmpR family regulator
MRLKFLLLISSLSFASCFLHAQNGKLRFSRFDIRQGLSHDDVTDILKDDRGFLWIGTMSGLNRYDGYKFKVFKNDLRDTGSIADDFIERLLQGPRHTLWVGTRNGFNIYDPLTEKFDHKIKRYLDVIHIPDTTLKDIKKDSEGNFWIICNSTGLYQYNTSSNTTIHYIHQDRDESSLCSSDVSDMAQDPMSGYWIVHKSGIIEKMDAGNRIVLRTDVLKKMYPGESTEYRIYIDKQGDLWIYASANTAKGIFYYDVLRGDLGHISKTNGVAHLNTDIVNGVTQDRDGLIWIATDHGGVNLLDKKDFSIRYILSREDDDQSISQNSINVIYKDNSNIIWIGTFKKGISYYQPERIQFPLYKHQPSDKSSLSYNDLNRFAEDGKGNLWIGSNGGGLIYFDRQNGKFTQYLHDPLNSNSLSNDVIVSLMFDHEQKLWIGTYYGGLDCYDGKKFIHFRHDDRDSNSIADDRIWALMEDSRKRFWIGTFESGLDLFDRNKNIFIHHKVGDNSVHSNYITSIAEDRKGNIWLATSYGINVIDHSTGNFGYYLHDDSKPTTSLSNNNVISILADSRGYIWAATRVGLDLFDPQSKAIRTFRTEDGLPDNLVLNILEDNEHNLWLSTPVGLSEVLISKDTVSGNLSFVFRNYDESDGLQGKEFNEKAALKTRSGEIIFGGANGFNIFDPQRIVPDEKMAELVLTDLQVFNKTISAGEKLNGHIILPRAIAEAQEIELKYNENVFSIEFAALNLSSSEKIKYAYKLHGFNEEWLNADARTRKATYTNLDPGDYVFKVRAANRDGLWSEKETSLNIKISPPFWKTEWAYASYILLTIGLLIFSRRMILQRAEMRFAIEQERREAHRLHDLDMMKIRFFTNVSHEFRTPLSLIITPLDKIIKNATDPSQRHQFQMIHRNARRLLNLVNQLLDFRKMEVTELKLFPLKGDIIQFIKDLSYSFSDIAEKNNIAFSFASSVDHLYTEFDFDKIERILFNLLSNAFKFTPEHGKVGVELNASKITVEETLLEINVIDTGIGIPKEKQEKIFERFFQNDVPGNMVNQGSGIGLAITKEFVKLHNGYITLESEENKGSRFIVSVPLKELTDVADQEMTTELPEDQMLPTTQNDNTSEQAALRLDGSGKNKIIRRPTVLLVEDNEDLRFYLKDNLKEYFHIVEARDGKTGWQRALSAHPDLIVSDITMPEMNGIDLCRKIKADSRTSFIPVILLTALTGEEKQLKGLQTGASDYMTKPFNFEILLSKIRNLLAQQETAKRAYQKQVKADPADVRIESPDEKFMSRALAVVEKNISNADLSVEELSREMYMSRVALYKKLLALSGKTPIEFIRSIRLKRAAQLLEKSKLTVSEIAYEVGFNNPKYFTKFFKSEFNLLPSAYQAEKRKEVAVKDTI